MVEAIVKAIVEAREQRDIDALTSIQDRLTTLGYVANNVRHAILARNAGDAMVAQVHESRIALLMSSVGATL